MEIDITVSDSHALDMLAKFMEDFDPTLDESMPMWVWNLTTLVDDILIDTGRLVDED